MRNNAEFEIQGRRVGVNEPPLVIAEIGINHGGSLESAIAIADAAIDAGAEVIKHQTHIVDDEMSDEARYIVPSHTEEAIFDIMARCALSEQDEHKLMSHVNSRNTIFISTPFSRAAVDRLVKFDVPAFKIGSGECNNYPLIKYISQFGKAVIMSTGMNSIETLQPSVEILQKAKLPYALLQCTNIYPTPPELVRLGAMQKLKDAFPEAVIGLSDHTTSNYTCLGAVALGASILERHFTDSMDREGPDISCSMDPRRLSDLIQGSRVIFSARGGDKKPVQEEKSTMDFAFASVVAIENILSSETLSESNIWVKRPGGGEFSADQFESLLGRKARVDIPKGRQIKKTDVQ